MGGSDGEVKKESWIMLQFMEMTTYKSIYRGVMCGWFTFSAIVLTTSRVKVGLGTALPLGFCTYVFNSIYLNGKEKMSIFPKDEDWNVERVSTEDS